MSPKETLLITEIINFTIETLAFQTILLTLIWMGSLGVRFNLGGGG